MSQIDDLTIDGGLSVPSVVISGRSKSKFPRGHSVQFYEDDSVLLEGLSPFIGSALGTGGAAIVIATRVHREGLAQRLAAWGVDLPFATGSGRYLVLDAAETLSRFMVDGWPDGNRFASVVGDLLAEVSLGIKSKPPHIALFGEMVSLLWAEAKIEAAIRLEQLWNNLAETHSFDLRCAYPIGGFGHESHSGPFQLICAEHSHVIPAESYSSLKNEKERLDVVSLLQQKAQTLQSIADERKRLYDEAREEIARRAKMEEALRLSEEFSRGILENSVDCLQVMDLDGRLVYTSPAGKRALQAVGSRVADFLAVDSTQSGRWIDAWFGEGRDSALAAARAGGIGSFQGQCGTSPTVSRWWDIKVCPMFDKNGSVERLMSISREITELKEMQSVLIQAEKLAAAGRLAATIAHELNNPLDAVTNLIYLAKISSEKSNNAYQYLEMADQELARVTHIAQQTLGFYRDQLNPVQVNIAKAVAGVLNIYKRRLQYKRLQLELRIDEDLEICTKEGELKQVLSNVISNAVDALHEGGTIWIRARASTDRRGVKTGVRITLADNGAGIPPEIQEKIFTPFFTTKRDVGTGIGLWVTRTLLEKHGGAIRCRSSQRSKTGTVMSLFLPNPQMA